jgi:membrane protein
MSNYQRRPRVEVPSLGEWRYASNRLFETYIGAQALIYIIFIASAQYIFGFSVGGFSNGSVLFFNFLAFLAILAVMCWVPMITKRIIGQGNSNQAAVLEEIAAEHDEEERDFMILEARLNGCLPPSRKQEVALIIIAVIFLFEVFYICAWSKGGKLVWCPEWIQDIILWEKSNTGIYPNDVRKKLFILHFDGFSHLASKSFPNEQMILESKSHTGLFLFHFIRIIVIPIIITCIITIFWTALNYLGVENIIPRQSQTDGQFIWSVIALLFMSLIAISFVAMFFFYPLIHIEMALSIKRWNGMMPVYMMGFLLFVIFLKISHAWFLFLFRNL